MDETHNYRQDLSLHKNRLDTSSHLFDKRLGHLVRPSERYWGLWTYVYNSEKVCGSLTYTCGATIHNVRTLASIPAGAGWRGHSVYWSDRTKSSIKTPISTLSVVVCFPQDWSGSM